MKIIENEPKKGGLDEEEKIKNLEFIKDNIISEVTVINGKKINQVKNELEEKISKFENFEKNVENLKNRLDDSDTQIQKVFKISNDTSLQLQNLVKKFEETHQIEKKFEKLKKEFTSFKDESEKSNIENELKKMISELNENSKKIELKISKSLLELETSQNMKLKTIKTQFEDMIKTQNPGNNTAQNQNPINSSNFDQNKSILELKQATRKSLIQGESNSYRIDTLRYDLDLIKDDIIRQRRAQGDYLARVSKLESKIEGSTFSKERISHSNSRDDKVSGNFMSEYSHQQNSRYQSIGDIATGLKGFQNQENNFRKSDDYEEGESFLKKFNSSQNNNNPQDFDINLSVINQTEESELMNRTDYDLAQFMINSGLRKSSGNPTPKKKRPVERKSDEVIQEDPGKEGGSIEREEIVPKEIIEEVEKEEEAVEENKEEEEKKEEEGDEEVDEEEEADVVKSLERELQEEVEKGENVSPSKLDKSLNQSFRVKRDVFMQSFGNSVLDPKLDDEESITLQVDDQGFLLDKEGYPVLDDDGLPIKLTEDNLEFFKENDLYTEEIIE